MLFQEKCDIFWLDNSSKNKQSKGSQRISKTVFKYVRLLGFLSNRSMGTRQVLPTTFQGYSTSYSLEENTDRHL